MPEQIALSPYEVKAEEAKLTKAALERCSVTTIAAEILRYSPHFTTAGTSKEKLVRTQLELMYSPITIELAFGWRK